MFEACQRAQTSQSMYRCKRLEWKAPLPDIQTDSLLQPDACSWFRAKSDIAYQRPSIVLVESAAVDRRSQVQSNVASAPSQSKSEAGDLPVLKSSGVLRRLTLSTASFFEFLFSDRWEDGYMLRVMPGQLLNNLLHGLMQLEKYHDVISYVTMAHTCKPSIEPCMKRADPVESGFTIDSSELGKVLVELEFFCPQRIPFSMTISEPQSTSYSADEESFAAVSLSMISGVWGDQEMPQTILSQKGEQQNQISRESTATDTGGRSHSCVQQSVAFSQTAFPSPDGAYMAQQSEPTATSAVRKDHLSSQSLATGLQAIITLSEGSIEAPQSLNTTAQSHLAPKNMTHEEVAALPNPFLNVTSSGVRIGEKYTRKHPVGITRSTLFSPNTWPVKGRTRFHPNISTEVLASASQICSTLEDSCEHLTGDKSNEVSCEQFGDDEMASVRCNIRGQCLPPPHTNCLGAYHMVREPFYERRLRLQSGFPPIQTPPPPLRSSQRETAFRWSDRWEDDAFLGPKLEDKSEIVCLEPVLEKYFTEGKEKKTAAAFYKQRSKLLAKEKKQREKEAKRKGKKKKRVEDSDDGELEDEADVVRTVDTERMDAIRKDVDLMQSEFLVHKPRAEKDELETSHEVIARAAPFKCLPSLTEEHGKPARSELGKPAKSELEKAAKSELNSSKGKIQVNEKEPLITPRWSKQGQPKTTQKATEKSPPDDVSPRMIRKKSGSYKELKRWHECPDFQYFYYYLAGKEESEIQSIIKEQKQSKCPDSLFVSQPDSDDDERLLADHGKGAPGEEKLDSCVKSAPEKERKKIISHQKRSAMKESERNSCKEQDQSITLCLNKTKALSPIPKADVSQVSQTGKQCQLNAGGLHILDSASLDNRQTDKSLKSTNKFRSKNKGSVDRCPGKQEKKNDRLAEDEKKLNHIYLNKEQEIQIRDAGLVISKIDPWHIYVPATSLFPDTHGRADLRNWLLKRREAMYKLIGGGKVILQINKARLWSIVRQLPSMEHHGKGSFPPDKTHETSETKIKNYQEICVHDRMTEHVGICSHLGVSDSSDVAARRPVSERVKFAKRRAPRAPGPWKTDYKETKGKKAQALDHNKDAKLEEKEFLKMMNINEVFDSYKLKSTYSFEKMFAHRMKQIPKYWQRIGKYSHPLKKKRSSSRNRSKKRTSNKRVLPPKDKEQGERLLEDSEPDDLYAVQDTHELTSRFFHQLLLALKLFVVRKERITSLNPVQSRVSITFTRRRSNASASAAGAGVGAGAAAAELKEPHDIMSGLEDDANGRHILTSLCRTLLMPSL